MKGTEWATVMRSRRMIFWLINSRRHLWNSCTSQQKRTIAANSKLFNEQTHTVPSRQTNSLAIEVCSSSSSSSSRHALMRIFSRPKIKYYVVRLRFFFVRGLVFGLVGCVAWRRIQGLDDWPITAIGERKRLTSTWNNQRVSISLPQHMIAFWWKHEAEKLEHTTRTIVVVVRWPATEL